MEVVINGIKYINQSEVDAIRADTWYAARKITDKVVGEIDFKDGDRCPFYEKYFNSINDYLSSLNLNSNDTYTSEYPKATNDTGKEVGMEIIPELECAAYDYSIDRINNMNCPITAQSDVQSAYIAGALKFNKNAAPERQ